MFARQFQSDGVTDFASLEKSAAGEGTAGTVQMTNLPGEQREGELQPVSFFDRVYASARYRRLVTSDHPFTRLLDLSGLTQQKPKSKSKALNHSQATSSELGGKIVVTPHEANLRIAQPARKADMQKSSADPNYAYYSTAGCGSPEESESDSYATIAANGPSVDSAGSRAKRRQPSTA